MKKLHTFITALVMAFVVLANVGTSAAQFSQAVVVLKGTVKADESNKPLSVKVSVRVVGDTAQEITSSKSNSETGKYLVVLKPGKKYWFHFEGENIMTKDVMVETPTTERTAQIVEDFTVAEREIELHAAPSDKTSAGTN